MKPSYLDSLPLTISEASSVKSEADAPAKKPDTGLEAGRTVTSILASSSSSLSLISAPESPKSPDPDPLPVPSQPEPLRTALAQPPLTRPESPDESEEVDVCAEEESWSGVLLTVGGALLAGVLLLKLTGTEAGTRLGY